MIVAIYYGIQSFMVLITLKRLSIATGLAGVLVYKDNLLSAAPVGLLGLLLLFQVDVYGHRFSSHLVQDLFGLDTVSTFKTIIWYQSGETSLVWYYLG